MHGRTITTSGVMVPERRSGTGFGNMYFQKPRIPQALRNFSVGKLAMTPLITTHLEIQSHNS